MRLKNPGLAALERKIDELGLRQQVEEELSQILIERKIAQLRKRRGFTQAALARRSGVSQPMIAQIESGKLGNLTLKTLARTARALGARLKVELIPERGSAPRPPEGKPPKPTNGSVTNYPRSGVFFLVREDRGGVGRSVELIRKTGLNDPAPTGEVGAQRRVSVRNVCALLGGKHHGSCTCRLKLINLIHAEKPNRSNIDSARHSSRQVKITVKKASSRHNDSHITTQTL